MFPILHLKNIKVTKRLGCLVSVSATAKCADSEVTKYLVVQIPACQN